MCVSLAGQVTTLDGEYALVDVGGVERRVSVAILLLEDQVVSPGDWLLIHTGFAVAVLDPGEAAELTQWRYQLTTGDGDR